MRIERLMLRSYGRHRDREINLASPSSGIVVIHGPNEAGKSTMMRAIDSLLFGIHSRTTDHFGVGRPSLRIEARLTSASGHSVDVVRTGSTKNPLVDLDGNPVPEDLMSQMLGGIDRKLFQTLFRLDHPQLVGGSEELLSSDGELGRLLFGATLGSGSLAEAQRRLEARCAELFKPAGSKPHINQALGDYRAAMKYAKSLRVRPRDWEVLDNRRKEIEASLERLATRTHELEARRSLLARIKVAHPNFVERDRAVGRLNELRNEGVVPSAQWAVAIEALVAEQARFRSMQVADGELVKARRSQLEKLAVDDRLLSGRGSLKHLAEQVGRYRKDEASLSTANAELGLANRELSQLVAEREALGDVYPVGPLKRAVEAARSESSLLDQIAENKRESLLASDRIEGLLRRLRIVHPDSADERALLVRSLPVPSSESVQAFRSQLRDLETEIGQSERSLADRRAQRAETVLALEAARSGVLAPDAETLVAARLRRDVGWASLRRKLDGGTGRSPAIDSGLEPEAVGRLDLPESWTSDAFEAAISTADVIADERYAEAEKLAVIDQFQHALAAHDDVIERLDEQLSRTRSELQQRQAAWTSLWPEPVERPPSPEDAQSWLADLFALRDLIDESALRDGRVRDALERLSHLEMQLGQMLVEAGCGTSATGFEAVLSFADGVVEDLQARHDSITALDVRIKGVRDRIPQRQADVDARVAELADWQPKWSLAAAAVGSDPAGGTGEAVARVRLISEFRARLDEEMRNKDRLAGLRDDIEAYETSARSILAEVAPDLDLDDVSSAVAVVVARVEPATQGAAVRDELSEQILKLEESLAVTAGQLDLIAAELDQRCDEINALSGESGDASLSDHELIQLAERGRRADDLVRSIAVVEGRIVEQGDGKSVDEIAAEIESHGQDPDALSAELAGLEVQLRELRDERADLDRSRGENQAEMARIDGSANASDAEQLAAERLAELGGFVDEYVRVSTAASLLRAVMAEYSEQNQGPILRTSSALFEALTGGEFSSLVTDIDGSRQIVMARRANGEQLATSELSDGTRDQMYLALRLAGISHHFDRGTEPVPLILDDLLVNFDDERSLAALNVLADLGARSQILMFTHERSLVDLATANISEDRCSVVHLDRVPTS